MTKPDETKPKPREAAELRAVLKWAAVHYAAAILMGNRDVIMAAYEKLEDAAAPFTVFHKQER